MAERMIFEPVGMHCGGCVARVQKALDAVQGVTSAHVSLVEERADVQFDRPATAKAILEAAKSAGYPARTEQITFEVEGMTCASCVARVQDALQSVDGVSEATVNLASNEARVTRLVGTAPDDDLSAASKAAGYAATRSADGDDAAPTDRHSAEARLLRTRALLAIALGLPVFVIEMGGHLIPGLHEAVMRILGAQQSLILQFVLTALVLLIPGRVFYTRGVPALLRGAPDMNSLVALGTFAAFAYSTLVTFAPDLLPADARHVYFEAAVVIVALILLGRMMEARAKGQAGAAIRALIGLRPDVAIVEGPEGWAERPLADVQVGDHLRINAGARIAVDGVVISGDSRVDEAMLTGEPAPVRKREGDQVTGGTMNGQGTLTIRATHVGSDTVLAKIIELVDNAQGARLPVQGLVDRITLYFVPAVLGIAALTVAVWLMLGGGISQALVAGVAVLIVACPCAMGLAVPVSIMVGAGRAAKLGILFRQGDAMQRLRGVELVAFDKTGTLTKGTPALTDFEVAEGVDRDEALALIASAEQGSEHPIASALIAAAQEQGLTLRDQAQFEAVTAKGIRAEVDGHALRVGSAGLMEDVDLGGMIQRAQTWAAEGKSALYAVKDGAPLAVLAVADPLRDSTPETVRALQDMGLRVAMVTGDAEPTARAIAQRAGITDIRAGLLPDEKVAALETLSAGAPFAFVGDGLNDAPALARADVGIAIGGGTDVAIEAADVVLRRDDPFAVVTAVRLSRKIMANIRENLIWAFGYNIALIPLAAGLFAPLFGWQLSPAWAAGAMALSSLFVLGNALRLRRVRLEGAQ